MAFDAGFRGGVNVATVAVDQFQAARDLDSCERRIGRPAGLISVCSQPRDRFGTHYLQFARTVSGRPFRPDCRSVIIIRKTLTRRGRDCKGIRFIRATGTPFEDSGRATQPTSRFATKSWKS